MTDDSTAISFTLVADEDGMHALTAALAGRPAVALDSEANALYAYQERTCLLQLAVPGAEFIVDPLAGLDLAPLGALLADPAVQKVVHAAGQDIACIKRDLGFTLANLFDTMWAARILGWPHLGLADILWEYFGVRSDKRFQRYNWGERPLRAEALAYARLDVRYLLRLRDLQAEALEQAGRTAEAAEVFAQMERTPPADPAYGPGFFWRTKGVYDLAERERAVLWELYHWRDEVARRRDRPPFKVLNDAILVQLAAARPRNKAALQALGLKAHLVQRYGRDLLAAVARGERRSPPRPLRRPRPDEDVQARYEMLRAWRQEKAQARGVAVDVILSNAVLWDLAARNPRAEEELAEVEELGPWKRQAYGAEILRVLRAARERG